MAKLAGRVFVGMVMLPFAVTFWLLAAALVFLIDRVSRRPRLKISRRKELKQELEEHFLPVLRAAGFDGPRAFKGSELCFDFRRKQGNVHHFLTIQFEKRGGPEFRINFSEDTETGIQERLQQMRAARGEAAEAMLETMGGKMSGIVGPGRIPYLSGFLWFSSQGPYCRLSAMMRRTNPSRILAERVAKIFEKELEAWWERRSASVHLHLTEYWFPGNSSAAQRQMRRWLLGMYWVYGMLVTCFIVILLTVEPVVLAIRFVVWVASK